MPTKTKTKTTTHSSPEHALLGVKRAASPCEGSSSKRAKADKGAHVSKQSSSTRGSLRRSTRYKNSLCGHNGKRHSSVEARDGSIATDDDGEVYTQSAIRRMFIDDEAVEGESGNEYEATEPEEDDGGSYVVRRALPDKARNTRGFVRPSASVNARDPVPRRDSPEKQMQVPPPDTHARLSSSDNSVPNVGCSSVACASSTSANAGMSTVVDPVPVPAPVSTNSRTDIGTTEHGAVARTGSNQPADVAARLKPALLSLLSLLRDTPELLAALDVMEGRSLTKTAVAGVDPGVTVPVTPSKDTASVAGNLAESKSAGVAPTSAPEPAAPATAMSHPNAPSEPDDSQFNGTKNCLDHELWAPVLRYRKIRPPPRIVRYFTRGNPTGVVAASFLKWSKHERLGFMRDVLGLACTNQYVNISRMPFRNLRVETGGSVSYPLNYITRRGTAEPALFVSLVEIKKCSLLSPDRIKRRDGSGNLEKKGIIANLFQQEFELMICNLGCIYNVDSITLPSWSTKAEDRGLTFHTKVTACHADDTIHGSPAKPGLFDPTPTSSKTRFPVQLVGAHRVPLFDASVDGFDIHQPFADLKELPDMQQEVTPGSVGVIFYTISDSGGPSRIEFNIHGFALVAEPPLDWAESE